MKLFLEELGKEVDHVTKGIFGCSLPAWTVTLQPEVQMPFNVHELQEKKGTLRGGASIATSDAGFPAITSWRFHDGLFMDFIDFSYAGKRHGTRRRGQRREGGLENAEELRLH